MVGGVGALGIRRNRGRSFPDVPGVRWMLSTRAAEAAVIDAYFADPLRRPDVTVPPALRFVPRANA